MNFAQLKWVHLIIVGLISLFIVYFLFSTYTPAKVSALNNLSLSVSEENVEIIKELSTLLNQAAHQIGQLSCKLNDDVAERGGWCSKISGKNSPQHVTDFPLALALSKYLKEKRVASFGDGPGKNNLNLNLLNV